MLMEKGLDTGPVVGRRVCPIGDDDTAGSLHDRLALLNAELLGVVVNDLPDVLESAQAQNHGAATYARKISPGEAEIDWTRPAAELALHIRAFAPVPGAWFAGARGRVRVLKAHVASGAGTPGCFLGADVDGGMQVATGDGVLTLETVQPAGSKPMAASAFLNGARLTRGAQMGPATPAGSSAEHGS